MLSKVSLTFGISSLLIAVILVFLINSSFNQIEIVIAHSHSPHISKRDHQQQHQNTTFSSLSTQQQQSPSSKKSSILQTTLSPLAISNNKETVPNVPTDPNKGVILTFGDGYQSQYAIAKPILEKYGYKGNFFVTCNKVGTVNKMTWPDLVQLYKEGNVIGSKTVDYGTKAMEGKDLNHLSAQQLEFEVGQSKQCLLDHGINTSFFAVPMNLANNNASVINTIAKYYTLAINGHSNLMYLHCNGVEQTSDKTTTDCRTYLDNGVLNPQNRYSVGEWSEQHIKDGRSYNDSQMFAKFVEEVNSQNKINKNGIINAIPLVAYHDIVLLPDVSLSTEPSSTTLNLFNTEMKYLHDNGFNVLTFYKLGYDDKNNIFYLKA
ncbi:MAG: polysaccharide deacetylase family protein [Candidatus Nitrosocosmicus sp.]